MAITILTEPQTIQPAYNEIMVVLDSTKKAENKFQYVIDVNVDAVTVSTLRVQSNPQGYGVVNLSKHIEPYIGSNINVDSADVKPLIDRKNMVFEVNTDSVNLGDTDAIGGKTDINVSLDLTLNFSVGIAYVLQKNGELDILYDYTTGFLTANLDVASGTATATAAISVGTNYNIEVAYTNDVLSIYVDGVLIDTDAAQSGAIINTVDNMYVGYSSGVSYAALMDLHSLKIYEDSLKSHLQIFKDIPDTHVEYDITLYEQYQKAAIVFDIDAANNISGNVDYYSPVAHNYTAGDIITVTGTGVAGYEGNQEVINITGTNNYTTDRAYVSATSLGTSVYAGNGSGTIPDPAVFTGVKLALNNVLKWRDYNAWNSPDYAMDLVDRGRFFTNVPSTMTTKLDDRFTFNIFNNNLSPTLTFLKVVTNDARTYYFENNASTSQRFISVSVGAYDLANSDNELYSGFLSDVAPVITDGTESYTVELVDSSGDTKSEVKTFVIDRTCSDYENYKLVYLNREGSFTTFNFDLAHSKNINAKKTNYRKNYGSYDATANSYGWSASDRGTVRLDTDISETYTINSNYIKEAYGNLIEDLIISPEVYHLDNGVLRSIDIQTNSVKLKQRRVEKLINYSLSFTYSNKNTVQR